MLSQLLWRAARYRRPQGVASFQACLVNKAFLEKSCYLPRSSRTKQGQMDVAEIGYVNLKEGQELISRWQGAQRRIPRGGISKESSQCFAIT